MLKYSLLGLLLCMAAHPLFAQFPEDALRYSTPGLGVGARALGMGMAYTAVANDFSATYWNPAGLGQMKLNEVTFGLSHISSGDQSSFFGNSQSLNNSATHLNDVGLVYPFPTSRGSLVFTLGYGRQSDYTTGLSFNGYNPSSSIIQTYAANQQPYPSDLSNNIAYQLYLANIDTLTGRFDSPINGKLTQLGTVLEGGGQNYWTVGGASEVARNLYLGLTLNFIAGSYSYVRDYSELDSKNQWQTNPFDFSEFDLRESVNDDLSGFTAKFGFLYKFAPKSRFGLTIKTPSWVNVKETYSQSARSFFDNGDHFSFVSADNVPNEYDVVTPFVFSAGISHTIQNLMLAGDVEYTDWTQMEFQNADQRLLDFNTQIKQIFHATANVRVGGEYAFPDAGFRLRGGFAYMPSPYEGDPASFARKYITGGLGFIIENAVAIDLGYAYGYWDSFRVNYDASSRVDEKITTNNLIGTVSYRF